MAQSEHPSHPDHRPGGLGFNDLLNVLWRWRWFIVLATLGGALAGVAYGIIVTPLHRASTTVQPGITYFNERGEPERQWRVNDIVQWYRRGDFNPTVANMLGEDPVQFRPVIFASHIPRGPQQQGGFTINLYTLSPDPQEAEAILSASIDAFNRFAEGDTTSSDVNLMRVRIRSNMAKQDARVAQVTTDQKKVELEIAAAREEVRELEYAVKSEEHERAELREAANAVRRAMEAFAAMIDAGGQGIDELRETRDRLADELAGLRETRDRLLRDSTQRDSALLVQTSIADLSDQLGELQRSLPDYQDNVLSWQATLRELRGELTGLEQQIEEKNRRIDSGIPAEIAEQQREIDALVLKRDEELPREMADHLEEKRNMQARLRSLHPLEAMGEPVSSARPVRPRKPRAIAILTLLGLAGSVLGAFVLDYLSRNWQDITRRPAR